ncbi:MAG: hypothetical protein JWN48_4826 [Myxococcaceae bacterium]|nr:hypothetical protein [Myxococcaceae bacterium]
MSTKEDTKNESAKNERAKTQTKQQDDIDEASAESFPASDAPTSWAGRDIPPDERKSEQKN